jgi:hypothetical protein
MGWAERKTNMSTNVTTKTGRDLNELIGELNFAMEAYNDAAGGSLMTTPIATERITEAYRRY